VVSTSTSKFSRRSFSPFASHPFSLSPECPPFLITFLFIPQCFAPPSTVARICPAKLFQRCWFCFEVGALQPPPQGESPCPDGPDFLPEMPRELSLADFTCVWGTRPFGRRFFFFLRGLPVRVSIGPMTRPTHFPETLKTCPCVRHQHMPFFPCGLVTFSMSMRLTFY